MKIRKVYISPLNIKDKSHKEIGWLLFFSTYANSDGSEPVAFVENEKGRVILVDPSQISFVYPLSELEKRDPDICGTQVHKEFFGCGECDNCVFRSPPGLENDNELTDPRCHTCRVNNNPAKYCAACGLPQRSLVLE